MDFKLTKSQKQIQKAARDFAKGEFDKDLLLEMEKNSLFPENIWKKACDLGFIGIHFDEDYSGGGLGLFENIIVAEEFCRKDSSCGTALMFSCFALELILRFGTKEQKITFLPKVAEGEMVAAGAFQESGTGFNLSVVSCAAKKDGDQWVISGKKIHVTNGCDAGFYIVLCSTEPDAVPEKGMSLFIVEKERDGISVTDSGEKLGARMITTAEIEFDNVRVPESGLIGKQGNGFSQIQAFFNENMILNAGICVGTARGALDRAVAYAKEREQFGRKIAHFEVIQHKIAEMVVKVELARLITHKAAWTFDQGNIDPGLAGMALQYASKAAEEVADEAVQIHGGYGYMHEAEVEHFYRDAKLARIQYSSHGFRNGVIADSVIGKIK